MLDVLFGNMPLVLLSAGLILMALEALSPGAHLIVIGVALVGAGLVGVLFPTAASPFILAALTLFIGLIATYVYREFDFYGGKGTPQTSDSGSLAGSTGYVTEPITTREGEVKLDEGGFAPFYSARTTSGSIEEGEEIIVLDPGGGNVLTVEALSSIADDEIDRALAEETPADGDSASEPSSDVHEDSELPSSRDESTVTDNDTDESTATERETEKSS
ncbi:NfeD family protein [Natrarchaeobius halalkaliphilus]|uniref:NfeD family protein n=1 Tax=Natrarchaeobius halalkaliphilus TaxID=1679091 RepID=A0A3N6LSF8_9EURY|nr:NfeD family protein [Natrarchaeobius halalkaliphilus]RQG92868.1 NfeD family protein [Natrarchaeobius halalkaliphilus]